MFGLLFLLPFIDRRPERNPFKRPIATSLLALVLGSIIGLTFLARYQDRVHPEFGPKLKKQEEEMKEAFAKPFEPQLIGAASAGAAVPAAPEAYAKACAACHGEKAEGSPIGPALLGVASKPRRAKEDLLKILDDATAYDLKAPMPKSFPKLSPEEKQQITEWLAKLK